MLFTVTVHFTNKWCDRATAYVGNTYSYTILVKSIIIERGRLDPTTKNYAEIHGLNQISCSFGSPAVLNISTRERKIQHQCVASPVRRKEKKIFHAGEQVREERLMASRIPHTISIRALSLLSPSLERRKVHEHRIPSNKTR